MRKFLPGESHLTLTEYLHATRGDLEITLTDNVVRKLQEKRRALIHRIDQGETIYGVNTGFGKLKNVRISKSDLHQLQLNLLRSHACGTPPYFSPEIARGMLVLRMHTLARGYSGIRPEVLRGMLSLYTHGAIPLVPEQGSVGASGDLIPLAHLSLPLLGEGYVLYKGEVRQTSEVIHELEHVPLQLQAREGLALINGTQGSTAVLAWALLQAYRTLLLALSASALTLDVIMGSHQCFQPVLSSLRPYKGFKKVLILYQKCLEGSEIVGAHKECGRVQDPYSIRCAPQVLGSVLDTLFHIETMLEIEMNSVTDNPLLLDSGVILHNGNFHGAPIALVADILGIAMATLGSLCERQIFLMNSSGLSQLPPFLSKNAGLNSGFMILHVFSASLVNENKTLAHPASVDTIPTSDNQEDHVSMSMWAARKALKIVENTRKIVAVHLMSACQALDFRRPLQTGHVLEKVYASCRRYISFRPEDAFFGDDLVTFLNNLDDVIDDTLRLLSGDESSEHAGELFWKIKLP